MLAATHEHRRQRLLELRSAVVHPYRYWFAKAIGVPDDYLARLEYPAGKDQRKNIGDRVMAKAQQAFGLQPGWFDLPLGTALPRGLQISSNSGKIEHLESTSSATVMRMNEVDISAVGLEVGKKLSLLPEELQRSMGGLFLASLDAVLANTEGPPKTRARRRPGH